jgi:hypothetical protein
MPIRSKRTKRTKRTKRKNRTKRTKGGAGEYYRLKELHDELLLLSAAQKRIQRIYRMRLRDYQNTLQGEMTQELGPTNDRIRILEEEKEILDNQIKTTCTRAEEQFNKGLHKFSRRSRLGPGVTFNTLCTREQFDAGSSKDDYICSKTSKENVYRWRARDNPGDRHNYVGRRHRYRTNMDDIIAYEIKKRISPGPLITKEQAMCAVQDSPAVTAKLRPRIMREAYETAQREEMIEGMEEDEEDMEMSDDDL